MAATQRPTATEAIYIYSSSSSESSPRLSPSPSPSLPSLPPLSPLPPLPPLSPLGRDLSPLPPSSSSAWLRSSPPPLAATPSSPSSPSRQLLAEARENTRQLLAPPPTHTRYDSFDEAFRVCQSHAKASGYALKIRRSMNKDKDGNPRRYDIHCVFGGYRYVGSSTGVRHGGTRKTECPFLLKVLRRKIAEDQWCIELINEDHNHDANDPAAFPEHRTLQPNQIEQVRIQTFELHASARAIRRSLKANDPGVSVTEQDIYNLQQKMRREQLGDLTATQAAIRAMDEDEIWHREFLDEEDRLERQIVLLDEGLSFWRTWSCVMMFDTTYNTNRYGMKLFQINGITCLGSIFPLAYALTHHEDADFFIWALTRLKKWLRLVARQNDLPENTFFPYVIITDMDSASTTSTEEVFPLCQRQLCIWHIAKNIVKAVKQRWVGPPGGDDYEAEDLVDYEADDEADDLMTNEEESPPAAAPAAPPKDALTQVDFLKGWRAVMHAKTPADCDARWWDLERDFPQQISLLALLRDYYMPRRTQWAYAYVKEYRNLGHYTTSPCESLHASAKSLLRNASQNLKALHDAMFLQYRLLRDQFQEKLNHDRSRVRDDFRHELLCPIVRKLSWKALTLMQKQYLRAKGSLLYPNSFPFQECSHAFDRQMGLPCWHKIYQEHLELVVENKVRRVRVTRPLKLGEVDSVWELRGCKDDENLYSRIRDPRVVPRRRAPQNADLAVPPLPPVQGTQEARKTQGGMPSQSQPPLKGKKRKPRAAPARSSNVEIITEAIRNIVREEIQRNESSRADPAAVMPSQDTEIIQHPVLSQVTTVSRTIHRSAAIQKQMERSPSQFELYEPPQASQGVPHPGPKEHPHVFPIPGTMQPISSFLPSVDRGSQLSTEIPTTQPIHIQNSWHTGYQQKRRRRGRAPGIGKLHDYEKCMDFS